MLHYAHGPEEGILRAGAPAHGLGPGEKMGIEYLAEPARILDRKEVAKGMEKLLTNPISELDLANVHQQTFAEVEAAWGM